MTKAEMKAMMASVQEAAAKAAESVMMKLVTTEAAPKAAPTDDAKAKRLAGLEKARAAKAAKRAAASAKPAAAKPAAPAAKPAAVKGRKTEMFVGNGQSVEVESDEDKGYAVIYPIVNGKRVKVGLCVRLSSWRVLCCVIRSAAVQDMDKFMVENGLCDRDIA